MANRHITVGLACGGMVVAMAGLAAQPPAGQAQPSETKALVIGTVVDAQTNQPVADAVVTVGTRTATSVPQRLMTTRDGRFVVRDVPAGTLAMTVQAPGYVNGQHGQSRPEGPGEPLRILPGATVARPRLALWKTASIAGVVLDEHGEPLTGVQVRAMRRSYQRGQPRLTVRGAASTDDRGQFRLGGLAPGDYVVQVPQTMVSSPARMMNQAVDAVMSGDMMGMAAQFADVAMSGGAVAPGGALVGDLMVGSVSGLAPLATADGGWLVRASRYAPAADATGEATLVALAPGESREGIVVTVPLLATVSVSGQVLGPAGPLANVGVRLRHAQEMLATDSQADVASATTRADGTFEMPAVPRGSYTLRVLRPGRQQMPEGQMAMIPAELRPMMAGMFASSPEDARALFAELPLALDKSVAGLTITTGSGATVAGRLEFVGGTTPPAPSTASIQITPLQVNWTAGVLPTGSAAARVQSDGTFTTLGYPPGRYAITVTSTAQGWRAETVDVNGVDVTYGAFTLEGRDITGVSVRMTNRASSVSGAVADDTGADHTESLVLLFPAAWREWIDGGMSPTVTRTMRAAQDGRFTIGGLPAREYLVLAVSAAQSPDMQNPSVIEHLARAATAVTLGDGATQTVNLRVQRLSNEVVR